MKTNTKMPLVSVILVNYKSEKVTGECADSVLKSEYPVFEVIIVDNASTPASRQYFQKKYARHKKVRLLWDRENLNYTGGNSLGAVKSRGAKLVFLNNDTVVEPSWLNELVECHRRHPRSIVQPKIMDYNRPGYIDNAGNDYLFPGIGRGRGHGEKDKGQYDREEIIDYGAGTCYLIDKNIFFKIGGFDNWYLIQYEDVDLQLRAKKLGVESWYCPTSVILHRGAYTLKTRKLTDFNLYHLRKNRLMTVIKNYHGSRRIVRLGGLFVLDMGLLLGEIMNGKTTLNVLKAYRAVLDRLIKEMIDRHRVKELASCLGNRDSRSLLDVGCGDGGLVRAARAKGWTAEGLDIRPPFGEGFYRSTFEDFQTAKKYDAVTLYHVLEHVKFPAKVLAKAGKLIKKNGVLVIELPLMNNYTELFMKNNYFAYFDPTHRHFLAKKKAESLFGKAGFEKVRKGFTLYEFPFHAITGGFRKSFGRGLAGTALFLPFKILTLLGLNEEVGRYYLKLSSTPGE